MQAIGGIEGNLKILPIFNKYKDTLNEFIDSSHAKAPDWLG